MEDKIREYIKLEINKMSKDGIKEVRLKGVYMSVLESVLGRFEDIDTNWLGI